MYNDRTHRIPENSSYHSYFVVDGTEALAKFGADAWDRVVCVMTTGQAWQFKPYKWNEPKTLFHHGTPPCITSGGALTDVRGGLQSKGFTWPGRTILRTLRSRTGMSRS